MNRLSSHPCRRDRSSLRFVVRALGLLVALVGANGCGSDSASVSDDSQRPAPATLAAAEPTPTDKRKVAEDVTPPDVEIANNPADLPREEVAVQPPAKELPAVPFQTEPVRPEKTAAERPIREADFGITTKLSLGPRTLPVDRQFTPPKTVIDDTPAILRAEQFRLPPPEFPPAKKRFVPSRSPTDLHLPPLSQPLLPRPSPLDDPTEAYRPERELVLPKKDGAGDKK